MAKFLRIGVHHKNLSGYTSKAWCVHRVGALVLLKWGAVEVRGVGRSRKIFWARTPQHKSVRCRTEQRARDYVRKAIVKRVGHRYEKLADSAPIGRIVKRNTAPKIVREKVANRRQATFMIVDIVNSTRM